MTVARPCTERDWPQVEATLTEAFVDYPPMRWMIEPEGYEDRLRTLIGLLTEGFGLERREIWVSEDVASVAIWASPEQRALKDPGLLEVGIKIRQAQGARADYARRSRELWEASHPEEPHWYLQTLGTRPDRQREGLGKLVCRPVLDRLDQSGEPAFVDTSTEGNVALYESLGFVVIGEWDMPEGGPHGWAMWRAGLTATPCGG